MTGLTSHLPVADEDDAFTRQQLAHFHETVRRLRALGVTQPVAHIENSAGIISYAAQAGDMVRPGLMLYGSAPIAEFQPQLRAVLTWKTRLTLVRDMPAGHGISYGRTFLTPRPMRIATLAVGYADGYQRHLSNRGAEVLIRGETLCRARPRDHGPDPCRRDRAAAGGSRRRSRAHRPARQRGNLRRRARGKVRHHPMGNLHRHRPRVERVYQE
ncbi:MAG: alanine racemase C-terminal domain-containing protein [Chthoniobacter sp.]